MPGRPADDELAVWRNLRVGMSGISALGRISLDSVSGLLVIAPSGAPPTANPAEPPVIRKHKRFEAVAEHLRQRILSQRLKDGDRLPSERELAERFSVGRPSVREAVRTLSQLGLVEIRAGEGAFVRKPGFPPSSNPWGIRSAC